MPTMRFPDGSSLPVDLDGDPYRSDDLGPWKVTRCCGAYATGTEWGIACRGCYAEVTQDAPARLHPDDPHGLATVFVLNVETGELREVPR